MSTTQLTEEQRVSLVADIKCGLVSRATMVLIVLELKPATLLDLFKWNENIDSVKEKITKAGLYYEDIFSPPFRNPARTGTISIARSQLEAERTAIGFRNPKKHHEEIGQLMGYPETAIRAFMGEIPRLENGDQEMLYERHGIPLGAFEFSFSRDHYGIEIHVPIGWRDALRLHVPSLYDQLLLNASRMIGIRG